MVGHENPGVNIHAELARELAKPLRISGKVLLGSETNLAVVASLDDVLRDAWYADTS